jgi:hypothetical protein
VKAIVLAHLAAAALLMASSAQAQYTFTFKIAGWGQTGSFNLNTNNLVFVAYDPSIDRVAEYSDNVDSFVFNGNTYTSLQFSVYNDSPIIGGNDGFQIMAQGQDVHLELDGSCNSSTINWLSPADLVTVLSSISGGQSLYDDPPNQQEIGSFISFQLAPTVHAASMQAKQFSFNVSGSAGATVVVQASTNIVNPVWVPIQTNTLTGTTGSFTDYQCTNYPGRFYRVAPQ